MHDDERTKRNALMDWQYELESQKNQLPFLDGGDRARCEERIAECKQWIAKIEAML